MEPDPLDLPTAPGIPPLPPAQTSWPAVAGDQPPSKRPPWTLLAALGGGCALLLIVILLLTLLLGSRGGTTTVLIGVAADQTATAGGAQGTVTAGGVPSVGGGTPLSGGGGIRPTPTTGVLVPPSIHQAVNQLTLSGFGEGSVVATCPAGELALSGGWAIPYGLGATVYRSSRSGTRAWAVYVNHPSSALVTSYAECLKGAPGATIAERLAQITVAVNATDKADATCNAGEVVVGGGFALDQHQGVTLATFWNPAETQWEGHVVNLGAASTRATIDAECLAYRGASVQSTAFAGLIITAGNRGSATSGACPSGSFLSGGAYMDRPGGAFVYTMQAQVVLGESGGSLFVWAASLYANTGHDVGFEAGALCLRV